MNRRSGAANPAGRLTRLTAYTDSAGGVGVQYTDYRYSKAGVVTRVTYPDDTTHGGPDRGFVAFFYDAALRLTRKRDQNTHDTDIVYDAMGRRLTVTKGTEVDAFTYTDWGAIDTAKRGTTGNPDLVSAVTRSYNGLMRLTRESQAIEEDAARHVDYDYDMAGNVLTLGYPVSGWDRRASFDALNRADEVKRDNARIADYDYLGPGGRVERLLYDPTVSGEPDVVLSPAYDGMGRVTRMPWVKGGTTTLADLSYAYDPAGSVTRKGYESRSGDPAETYDHDALHRLTRTDFGQRSGDPHKGFIYDDLGNHLTQDDDGTTIPGAFNAVNEQTSRGGSSLTWSKTGNLTEDDDGQQYFYDRDNMLTRVEDGSNNLVEQYKYDALGRRIVADDGTDETRFYYSARHQIIEETDGSDTLLRYYVWTPGAAGFVDELLLIGRPGSGGVRVALRDRMYNVIALVGWGVPNLTERYGYNPYGERIVLDSDYTLDADGESDFTNPLGHQGLRHDAATGLIYNRARMRDPIRSRWMQRDPLGYVDGANLYAAYHLLIGSVDPSGMAIPFTDFETFAGPFEDMTLEECLSKAADWFQRHNRRNLMNLENNLDQERILQARRDIARQLESTRNNLIALGATVTVGGGVAIAGRVIQARRGTQALQAAREFQRTGVAFHQTGQGMREFLSAAREFARVRGSANAISTSTRVAAPIAGGAAGTFVNPPDSVGDTATGIASTTAGTLAPQAGPLLDMAGGISDALNSQADILEASSDAFNTSPRLQAAMRAFRNLNSIIADRFESIVDKCDDCTE